MTQLKGKKCWRHANRMQDTNRQLIPCDDECQAYNPQTGKCKIIEHMERN